MITDIDIITKAIYKYIYTLNFICLAAKKLDKIQICTEMYDPMMNDIDINMKAVSPCLQ